VIVIGTALAVAPVNQIVNEVGDDVPSVLINMTDTIDQGFPFNLPSYPQRLFLQGKCDEVVAEIVKACGW
jgi:NAD-dependent SIR2 family protein deacetylase